MLRRAQRDASQLSGHPLETVLNAIGGLNLPRRSTRSIEPDRLGPLDQAPKAGHHEAALMWYIPIIAALIGVAGGIAGTVLADRLRRQRHMSDKEQFREWLLFFDRPAWRGPFTWKSDPRPYEQVLTDTIKAINTGHLVTRGGAELSEHRVRGKSQLRSPQLRGEMDEIVERLERVRTMVRQTIDDAGRRAQFASQIDIERDEIVGMLNRVAERFRLQGLPLPTSFTDMRAVYAE